jgi:hippurate hydrolase
MFQPGEEGFFGARVMLDEGFLDDLSAENARAFAVHISAQYHSGEIHSRPGALLASADNFSITVRGSGGHASAPHNARDPIPVAAEIITALQVVVAREIDVFDPVVLTIGHVAAGTTYNIIPGTAHLEGTFRCVSDGRRAAMPDLIRRVIGGVAAAHRVEAEVAFTPLYPVTMNDAGVFERVGEIARRLLGPADVRTMPAPMMAAEDWSPWGAAAGPRARGLPAEPLEPRRLRRGGDGGRRGALRGRRAAAGSRGVRAPW